MRTDEVQRKLAAAERANALNGKHYRRKRCPECAGQGFEDRGLVLSIPQGAGKIVNGHWIVDPCETCKGTGWVWFDGREYTLDQALGIDGAIKSADTLLELLNPA